MTKYEFAVIGAGPAGAAYAYFAANNSYKIIVYDYTTPGKKPCGWAVPIQVEKYLKIPHSTILTKIKSFSVYIDGELAHRYEHGTWGYIIDKPLFLKELLEGIEFEKRHIDLKRNKINAEKIVVATGSATTKPKKEYLLAIQQIIKVRRDIDEEHIEVWFSSDMIGYYWVFPRTNNTLDIGVGGLARYHELKERLEKFIKNRYREYKILTPIRGAHINISGVNIEKLKQTPPIIGEAAGFVYPLTGEGIRPAIASAHALYQDYIHNRGLGKDIINIARWIEIQRKILGVIKRADYRKRAEVIKKMPTDIFIKLGLGELHLNDLLRNIHKLPLTIVPILKTYLKEKERSRK